MEALQAEMLRQRLEVVDRAALGAPVIGDEAVARAGERGDLVLPQAARARAGVQEDGRRTFAAAFAAAVLIAQAAAGELRVPQRWISLRYFSTPGWMSSRRGAATAVFAIVVSRACSRGAASGASARCTARASR